MTVRMTGAYPDLFDPTVLESAIARITALTPTTQPQWGKMSVAQMLAHVCVPYEMLYTTKHPRPGPLIRWLLRTFIKQGVVGPKPYPRSATTAPAFRIVGDRDFVAERDRLIGYLRRVAAEGRAAFEGRDAHSFGSLTADEWNVMFSKHLDHHLTQFGV